MMIVMPLVLTVLSRSVVGIPVAAIGIVSYIAGRAQAGSSLLRDVIDLMDPRDAL